MAFSVRGHRWPPNPPVAPQSTGGPLKIGGPFKYWRTASVGYKPPILYKYIKQIDFNNYLDTHWDIYGHVSFIECLSPERSQYEIHISQKRLVILA